jgi:hypothetical protein
MTLGLCRLIAIGLLFDFDRIIRNCKRAREQKKDSRRVEDSKLVKS